MINQIKIGAILQYVQMALSIIVGIVYTPIMLNILGQSEYGIYSISSSIIAYLSLLSLGFGSSYIRFYVLRKKQDPDKISNLNGLYLLTFTAIGIVAIVSGLVLAFNVSIFLNNSYSIRDAEIAKYLMILLAINLGISFPTSLFSSYITAHEKFIFLKLANIGKTVLAPSLSIIALFFGYGSIGLVIATTIINLFIDLINVFYCLRKLKMRFSFHKIEFGLLKEIFVFSFFIAINQLIDQINWQTDKIILGKMLTSSIVSIYAIGSILNTYYIQFSTAISSLFTPKINKIVVDNEEDCNETLTKMMSVVGRIQFMVLMLIMSGFIFFGKKFIAMWAGNGYNESYYVALLLMIPETIPLIQNIGVEIQRAKNKHQFRSVVYLIMAVINVGISIVLCLFYGVLGVAFGTTISIIISNVLIMNIYYHKKLKLNMFYFWKEIIKIIPSLLIPIIIGVLFNRFVPINNIFDLIKQIFVYSSIYLASIFMFGMNKNEKTSALKFIKK